MAMNPDENKMEMAHMLQDVKAQSYTLYRPDGTEVPDHWSTYHVGEKVVVKNYTWEVAHIGEKHLLLEPVGPVIVGQESP